MVFELPINKGIDGNRITKNETEVNKKVEKKLAEKGRELLYSYNRYESELETKYRIFEAKYMAGFILTLVYGIVVTLIQMFKSDLIGVGKAIADTGAWVTRQFINLINQSNRINNAYLDYKHI